MDIMNLLDKAYWHLFKVMPCEMILKKKWNQYVYIDSFSGHHMDLSSIKALKEKSDYAQTIWIYWDSGLDNAPKIVKSCFQSVLKYKPEGWSVVFLDAVNLKDYIALPAIVENLLQEDQIYKATYSDFLRTALLYEYGGVWMDSTCLLTSEIPSSVLSEELFLFRMGDLLPCEPERFESWFIRSVSGNYAMKRILEDLLFYFETCKYPKRVYYVWFYLLSSIYNKEQAVRDLLKNTLYWNHMDAILVADFYGLGYSYSPEIWEKIKSKCFVQKLTYKYDTSLEQGNTLLTHILNCSE